METIIKGFWVGAILAVLALNQGCGRQGDVGPQGTPGASVVGPQGVTGVNGSTVTPILLCSGVTPSYPNTFPEYAICLNNQLYGVYSSQGGFMALLPPGTYTSDGINASCTVTVGLNCQVSN